MFQQHLIVFHDVMNGLATSPPTATFGGKAYAKKYDVESAERMKSQLY